MLPLKKQIELRRLSSKYANKIADEIAERTGLCELQREELYFLFDKFKIQMEWLFGDLKEGDYVKEQKEIVHCPLCGEALEYRKIKDRDETHAYICPECSFVGIEFLGMDNIKDLKDYFEKQEQKT